MRRVALALGIAALAACGHETVVPEGPEVNGISGTADGVDVWYASPTGTAGGNGSAEFPWRLDSALAGGRRVGGVRPVGPGDTVYIRGGTYVGRFNATVGGQPGLPVVFTGYPGEKAVIDGNDGEGSGVTVFAVQLPWVEVRNLEIFHSNPARNAALSNVVSNYASHNRFANLVLHDGGVGLFNEHNATDVEITDCVIFNNGWLENNEGHGHGLYLKSDAGPVTARGNVIFGQFGFGIHAYSERLSTGIDSVVLEGNVVFNNSTVHTGHHSANILLGGVPGFGAANRSVVSGNLTYFAPGVNASNVKIGYDTTRNGSVTVTRNVFAGGIVVLDVHNWSVATVTGDTLIGDPGDTSRVVALTEPNHQGFAWTDNRFFQVAETSARWRYLGTSYPLASWQSQTSFTADSVVAGAAPARVVAWRGTESGRGLVSVYNGSGGPVDLAPGTLEPGDSFVVRDVQRLAAGPVTGGRFNGGPIALPVGTVTPVAPINWPTAGPGTGDVLHVYLVERVAGSR